MRVALATKTFVKNDIRKNVDTIIDAMREARSLGAEIILFSEACLQGFDALKWNYDLDKSIACNIYSEPINLICKESKNINLDVIFGYYEKDRDLISSSCLIIERGEPIYNYKRLTSSWNKLYKKDRHYYQGQVVEEFEYRHKRCMIALGEDLSTLSDLYYRNEEIIFCPVHDDYTTDTKKYEDLLEEISSRFGETNILVVNEKMDASAFGAYYLKDGKIIISSKDNKSDIILVSIDE